MVSNWISVMKWTVRLEAVKAYNYYESDIVQFGASKKLSSYGVMGTCAAFMELAYAGDDPKGKTIGTYECKQLKGIECGDSYVEFVVFYL